MRLRKKVASSDKVFEITISTIGPGDIRNCHNCGVPSVSKYQALSTDGSGITITIATCLNNLCCKSARSNIEELQRKDRLSKDDTREADQIVAKERARMKAIWKSMGLLDRLSMIFGQNLRRKIIALVDNFKNTLRHDKKR